MFAGPAHQLWQYLGLDSIQASEPQDLSATQLPFSTVDLLLILCQLLSFFLPRLQAKPRFLQTWQPLRWHSRNHLKINCFVSLWAGFGWTPIISCRFSLEISSAWFIRTTRCSPAPRGALQLPQTDTRATAPCWEEHSWRAFLPTERSQSGIWSQGWCWWHVRLQKLQQRQLSHTHYDMHLTPEFLFLY